MGNKGSLFFLSICYNVYIHSPLMKKSVFPLEVAHFTLCVGLPPDSAYIV